jgi:Zn-dependent alcohol dehydrogenase
MGGPSRHSRLLTPDPVAGSVLSTCGSCARCQSGHSFQCQHPEATLRRPAEMPRLSRHGVGLFQGLGLGGFAERALIHENQLALLPKDMPFAQAALLGCGVVTGAGAVLNTAHVRAGDTVVIFGAGGVGLNAISGARIAGASKIVATDIRPKRLQAAQQFAATDIIDSTKADPVDAVPPSPPRRRRPRVRLRRSEGGGGARARHAWRRRRPPSRRRSQARGQPRAKHLSRDRRSARPRGELRLN